MYQREADSIPISVIGVRGELRSAVEAALEADGRTTVDRVLTGEGDAATGDETSDPGDGESAVESEADGGVVTDAASLEDRVRAHLDDADGECVVCGADPAVYDGVRAVDGTLPVVVVGDAADAFAERVLEDLAAEYVDTDRLDALLPARVERLVRRRREQVDWRLADVADEAVVAFDLETGALREANEQFFDQWGYERAGLAGATLADLRVTDITHELRGQGREPGEANLEWTTDGDPVAALVENARNGDFEVREWHCEGRDGERFKSEVRVLPDEPSGRGYLVATVPEDADEDHDRRGGPVVGHDEASMLRSVMEHVPMSVYFEDHQGRHVLVSEDLVEPFVEGTDGKIYHTPEDVQGQTYWDLYTEDMAERATEDNERIMATGEPLRGQEKHVQPPGGPDLWFSTHKAPWYDDEGRVQGIVGITVDISEQKRRERELDRQNERLSEFASIVSHDLRNPLSVAQARLELYRRTGDDDHLETVAEMHERMERLIEDVLTFAREGSRVEETECVDPTVVANRAWGSVETGAATLETDCEYEVRCDSDRLVRLFENCFENAIEHGRPDAAAEESAITVRVGTLDGRKGFYVEDDGVGIDVDGESVFERGVSEDPEGTGFGLAIVREITEAHGWEVTAVDGDDADGARFEFTGVGCGATLDDEAV